MSGTHGSAGGPIFLVGTMRSGSTLLRLVLDSHENIAIGPESGFMGAVEAMHSIPGWASGAAWYRRYGVSDTSFDARTAAFFRAIFSEYAAAQGKGRWGEKTPFHTWHIATMARLFPDARFVAIVRHPAATVASTQRWRYDTGDAISKWVRANSEIVRQARAAGAERFAVCRYEDLVLAPRVTLGAVLAFLDEPWSETVLHHHERGGAAPVEGGTRADEAIDPARVAKWTTQLGRADRERVATGVPDELLQVFGYDVNDPVPRGLGDGLLDLAGVNLDVLPVGKYGGSEFDSRRAALPKDPEVLAHRLAKAERKLEQSRVRVRARRATRRYLHDLIGRSRRQGATT